LTAPSFFFTSLSVVRSGCSDMSVGHVVLL
jgi:hypothetical protein